MFLGRVDDDDDDDDDDTSTSMLSTAGSPPPFVEVFSNSGVSEDDDDDEVFWNISTALSPVVVMAIALSDLRLISGDKSNERPLLSSTKHS